MTSSIEGVNYNDAVEPRKIPPRRRSVSAADQAWRLLLQVSFDRVHRHFAVTVAEFDLAPAQAFALHELQVDQPLSMRELANRLRCDPSNITGLIDRLETRGLVERRAHPADRRVKYLLLTATGFQLRQRLSARLYAAPSWVADLQDEEQRILSQLLLRMLEDTGL
jgi:MarR family transcriptional regulator, organic hydroperoxide resistance regulator